MLTKTPWPPLPSNSPPGRYYDLEELRKEYGTVTGYTDPKPGRYHAGCCAGDLSQTGQVRAGGRACVQACHSCDSRALVAGGRTGGQGPCRACCADEGRASVHHHKTGNATHLPAQNTPARGVRPPPSHQVCELLLRSLAEQGRYDEPDFCGRLDTLLDTLDGTAEGGRYTDVAMREVWRARKRDDLPWGQAAGWSNTSEAAQRAVVLAARRAACYAPTRA